MMESEIVRLIREASPRIAGCLTAENILEMYIDWCLDVRHSNWKHLTPKTLEAFIYWATTPPMVEYMYV